MSQPKVSKGTRSEALKQVIPLLESFDFVVLVKRPGKITHLAFLTHDSSLVILHEAISALLTRLSDENS